MAKTASSVAKIHPVPFDTQRPLWSVMIPTYNCANYLETTLKSVLVQDLGPEFMQIEVIDDCSTKDNPEDVVREIGKGRISFFKQPQNVGITNNFNTCIARSIGKVVHILHGDDYVLPEFYTSLSEPFKNDESVGAAFCRYGYVNEANQPFHTSRVERDSPGIISSWLERISTIQLIQPPSIVVRRSVYEEIGGFHTGLSHAADWEMWKRIAVKYAVWYDPKMLACYRIHSVSDSSLLKRSGKDIADIRKSIEIADSYLPRNINQKLTNEAKEHYAIYAISMADRYLKQNDIKAAYAQIREAFKCHCSPMTIKTSIRIIIMNRLTTRCI